MTLSRHSPFPDTHPICYAVALFVVVVMGVAPASAEVAILPADRILDTLVPNHPRLPVSSAHWGWHRSRHNWNQVCNGGVGIGALAIAEDEPQLAARVLHHSAQSIRLAMEQFAPDGACVEGPGYFDRKAKRWNYYRMRAESHNTLVINPDAEPDQEPDGKCAIARFDADPHRPFAIADVTDGSPNRPVRDARDGQRRRVAAQPMVMAPSVPWSAAIIATLQCGGVAFDADRTA